MTRDSVGSRPVSDGEMLFYSFWEWLNEIPLHDWQKPILREWEGKMAPDMLEYLDDIEKTPLDPATEVECDFDELIADIKNV